MKRLLLAAASASSLMAFGATYTVDKASDLAASYGADTINYTGSGDGAATTHSGALKFNTTAATSATTVTVAEGKKLTLNGELTGASGGDVTGALIKNGPGELVLDSARSEKRLSFKGTTSSIYGSDTKIKWTDGAATTGFGNLNVVDGKLTIPQGQYVYGYNSFVGIKQDGVTPNPPAELAVYGELDAANILGAGYFCVATDPYKIYVGPTGKITTGAFWFNFQSAAETVLEVDGGYVHNNTKGFTQGVAGSKATLTVKNGGTLDLSRYAAGTAGSPDVGYAMDALSGTTVKYDISGAGSMFKAVAVGGSSGSKVSVTDGASNLVDRTRSTTLLSKMGFGEVYFDNATLAGYTPTVVSDWYSYANKMIIGPGGLTVASDLLASLGGHLQKKAGETAGTITKEGTGIVAFAAGSADIDVKAGTAAMTVDNDGVGTQDGRITAAAGTTVSIGGNRALGDMTLVAGEQQNVFVADPMTFDKTLNDWSFVHAASPRRDGWISLNNPVYGSTNGVGAIWNKTKMDLTRSFTITFDYANTVTLPQSGSTAYTGFGFSIGWQNVGGYKNSARDAHGGTQRLLGWGSPWAKSFAFGQDSADGCSLHYTVDGSMSVNEVYHNAVSPAGSYRSNKGTFAEPLHQTLTYDALTHKATFTTRQYDGTVSCTVTADVNLEDEVAAEAYFGFGGGNTSQLAANAPGRGGHYIRNLRIAYDDEPAVARTTDVGGKVTIAAGQTFKAKLEEDAVQKGWTLDEINFGAGATIEVSGATDAVLSANRLSGSGTLTKTGPGTLSLASTAYNPSELASAVNVADGTLAISSSSQSFLAPLAHNWMTNANFGAGAYAPANVPKYFSKLLPPDGFAVGRASNGSDRDVALYTCRTRVKVATDWEISYDLKIDIYNVAFSRGFYGIVFHNDPDGLDAFKNLKIKNDGGGWINTQPTFCRGLDNVAAIVWNAHNGNAKDNHVVAATGTAENPIVTETSGWQSLSPVCARMPSRVTPDEQSDNYTGHTNAFVKLSYEYAAKKLTVYMSQPVYDATGAETGAKTEKTVVFENYDIEAAVGGQEYAYMAFGANNSSEWYGMRQTVTNLKYVDANGKLAETLTMGNGATLKIAGDEPVGAKKLVANGAMTIDGGIYRIESATAVEGLRRLNLTNGAKLYVPEGVTVSISRLLVDGVRVDDSAPYVVGGGTVSINPGLIILVQ